eukprot:3779069-Prymnesium_polylepis.1
MDPTPRTPHPAPPQRRNAATLQGGARELDLRLIWQVCGPNVAHASSICAASLSGGRRQWHLATMCLRHASSEAKVRRQ